MRSWRSSCERGGPVEDLCCCLLLELVLLPLLSPLGSVSELEDSDLSRGITLGSSGIEFAISSSLLLSQLVELGDVGDRGVSLVLTGGDRGVSFADDWEGLLLPLPGCQSFSKPLGCPSSILLSSSFDQPCLPDESWSKSLPPASLAPGWNKPWLV